MEAFEAQHQQQQSRGFGGGFNSFFSGGGRASRPASGGGGGSFFNNFRSRMQFPQQQQQQQRAATTPTNNNTNELLQKRKEQMKEFTTNLSTRFQQDTASVSESFMKLGRKIQPQPSSQGDDLLDGGDGGAAPATPRGGQLAESLQKTGKQASESFLKFSEKIKEESGHLTENVAKIGKQIQEESKPEAIQMRTGKISESLQKSKEQMKVGFSTIGLKMQEERQVMAQEFAHLKEQIQHESKPESMQKRREEMSKSLQNSQKQMQEGFKHFSEDLMNLSSRILSTSQRLSGSMSGRSIDAPQQQQQQQQRRSRNNNSHMEPFDEEDWQVREIMKKQATDEATTEILLNFLTNNGESATYEAWITELFQPKKQGEGTDDKAEADKEVPKDDKPIGDQFYFEDSDHRRLWNEFAGPERQVAARSRPKDTSNAAETTTSTTSTAMETETTTTTETSETSAPPPSPSFEYVIDDDDDDEMGGQQEEQQSEDEITFEKQNSHDSHDDLLSHAISMEINQSPNKIPKSGGEEEFSLL